MNHIKTLNISNFKTIKKLTLSNLKPINIILGDNNTGKTTILEAIKLLCSQACLSNITKLQKEREPFFPLYDNFFDYFINLFNNEQDANQLEFSITSENEEGSSSFEILGSKNAASIYEVLKETPLVKYSDPKNHLNKHEYIFKGMISKKDGNEKNESSIKLTSIEQVHNFSSLKNNQNFISSFSYLHFDLLSNLIKTKEYKKLTIKILKTFNEEICGILEDKTTNGAFIQSIITKNGQIMPISAYGDGVRRILFILNKLIESKDSILLIDGIELGLSPQHFAEFFANIFTLALKLKVQLFITTQSLEAIEAILKFGNYETNQDNDPIKIITLRKIYEEVTCSHKIVARNVLGRYVYENQKTFNFDVRF
ncbi:MAG: AAA family ATPase [Succinivibrionaceae bacterium]|nr:AAA family ATPase [Succinivibrionaceae bacterium]